MPKYSNSLDNMFHALGDPTRRSILERLSMGPATVGELAVPFKMALPSLMQHLGVLEDSSLVWSEKVGRVRTYKLTQDTMKAGEDWFVRQRTHWDKRLDQLDSYLLEMKEKENGKN